MKGLYSVLCGMLALSCVMPLAYAESGKEVVEPSGHDRGLYGDDLTTPAAAPVGITVTKFPAAGKAIGKPSVKFDRGLKLGPSTATKGNSVNKNITKHTPPASGNSPKQASVSRVEPVATETSHLIPVSNITPAAGSAVITAWLNKPGSAPKYKVGEKMQINVTAASDCNLVVLDFDGRGKLTQIFPNEFQSNGFVKAGDSVVIGGPDSPFDYEISGRGGAEKIFVYAYPQNSDNPLTVAMAPVPNSPFRAAEMSIQQYTALVASAKAYGADRDVKVVAKNGIKPVSMPSAPANKIELTFEVDTHK
jgi:hypothetical protein